MNWPTLGSPTAAKQAQPEAGMTEPSCGIPVCREQTVTSQGYRTPLRARVPTMPQLVTTLCHVRDLAAENSVLDRRTRIPLKRFICGPSRFLPARDEGPRCPVAIRLKPGGHSFACSGSPGRNGFTKSSTTAIGYGPKGPGLERPSVLGRGRHDDRSSRSWAAARVLRQRKAPCSLEPPGDSRQAPRRSPASSGRASQLDREPAPGLRCLSISRAVTPCAVTRFTAISPPNGLN